MKKIAITLSMLGSFFLLSCDSNHITVTTPQEDGRKIGKKYMDAIRSRDQSKVDEAEEYKNAYMDAYLKAGRSGDEIMELMDNIDLNQ